MFSLNINDIKEITDDLFGFIKDFSCDFSEEFIGDEGFEMGEAQDAFEFSSNLYTVHTSLLECTNDNFEYQKYKREEEYPYAVEDQDAAEDQSDKINDDLANQEQCLNSLSCVAPSFTPLKNNYKEISAPPVKVSNNNATTATVIEQQTANCISRCLGR